MPSPIRSLLSSRKKALEAKEPKYNSGTDCSKGHVSPDRYTSNGKCVACSLSVRTSVQSRENIRKYDAKRYQENKEKIKQRVTIYRANHPEKKACRSAKERATRLQRTPKWADLRKIAGFYKESKRLYLETGIIHHVDHIIPLCGKIVSGLHVENNLRVIPASENLKKSNTFLETLIDAF